MIAVSYLATPLQFLLFIPFINIGASIVGTQHTLLTVSAIKESFQDSFLGTLRGLSFELLCGFIGWLLVAVPVAFLLYFLFRRIFSFFNKTKLAI